jgi:hypothetical protein
VDDSRPFVEPFFGAHRRFDEPAKPEWFEPLVRLMVDGPGTEDRVLGVVRAQIEDDGGTIFQYRVARRGELVRCTSLDGAVHMIANRDRVWCRRDGSDEVDEYSRSHGAYPPDDYEFGVARTDNDRWQGDDFTTPIGSPRETTFLGRPAWEIDLAAPEHKPHPMQITIDRQTGLVLCEANSAFATLHEWTQLDTDADLPDSLFTWSPNDAVARRYS